MSETTWETIVEQYKEQAKRDGTRIDELRQSTEHWHDTAQMLKRQRDMAEEERDGWKIRAMQSEQGRQALRAECEALRKVDDAMVGRAWQSLAAVCGVVCYNEDGEYMPFHHINLVEREDVRAAVTAAMAVQPATGGEHE